MATREQKLFADTFTFSLGQLVRHKLTRETGVVIARALEQHAEEGITHTYTLSFSMFGERAVVLESELEAADG